MWHPRLLAGARLKYLGIVDALEADIRSGRVARGDRLPPQRAIAEALDVDLTTVTRAFNEARRRGLVDAQAGRGTFVSEALSVPGEAPAPRPLIDLSMNIPPQPDEAQFARRIPETIASLLAGPRGLLTLHYQDSTGTAADRAAGARWLSDRLPQVTAQRLVVAGGAQCALFAVCDALLKPGDVLLAGDVTYPGLKAVAAQLGLRLVPLAMDGDGIRPEAVEAACRAGTPRALYVIPTLDNPTTATLPEARRRALADLARRHDLAVIEDDPYAPLCPAHIPALAELVPERTWHIATLSKCATPALRTAYVAAPGADEADRLAGILRATSLMAPPLMTALASRWILDGTLDLLARAIRAENGARQALARAALKGQAFAADPHGHHVWLRLPAHWRAADFAEHADRAGVSIVAGSAFAIGTPGQEAVRLSLGVAPDRGALEDGLALLAALLARPAAPLRVVV